MRTPKAENLKKDKCHISGGSHTGPVIKSLLQMENITKSNTKRGTKFSSTKIRMSL